MADQGYVISGISGRFPQADDLVEFKEKLYAGADFVTDDEARWPRGILGVPERMGTIRDLTRFDAQFFSVPPRQANVMEPQLRLLLETTYEAIVDAGYDPATLRGRKIGVFVGSVMSETFAAFNSRPDKADGYTTLISLQSTLSNRISFCFDFRGPSCTVDTASSSSMTALNHAMLALRAGQCDAAIVGGSNLLLNPCSTLNAVKLNMVSPEGRCKSFDKDGPTYPSGEGHERLLHEVYAEAKVDPRQVLYVETHGTGTPAGDPKEAGALSSVLCAPGRTSPLKLGSVKSNMGHCEGASAIPSLAKVILAMETGIIAGNLHFNEPHPDIPALHDGRLEVITEPVFFPGGLVGLHSCGVGGTNIHAILESNPGPCADTLPRHKRDLPRLALMAGRTRDSLAASLERLCAECPSPDSTYALLNNVGQPSVKQFPYRGYALVPVDGSAREVVKVAEQTPSERRPLWFAFTGLGCQWDAMGEQMMQFDLFADSIQKSHEVMKDFGIDLIALITSKGARSQSPSDIFVSIVAIQVALVDTLHAMGIKPDGILGHSLGETGCGYADGTLSAEQALLCAYWRGRCTELGNLPQGAMAAVGLTWEEAQNRCSNGVEAVCHNAEDSVTVSGPSQTVAKLVEELTAESVFARKVDSLNVAFHSSHTSSVGPAMRKALQKVIPQPKLRGERWISSSVPECRWNEPTAKHCCADYFLNNFLSPVLFREAMQHVPSDAIVVEIAPHCLLQPIIRRSMGPNSSFVGLMKRNADNPSFFLSSLGRLHTLGVQMDLSPLYPPIPWPVPRGTPSIGHLVAWDHTQTWGVVGWEECISLGQASHESAPSEEFIKIDVSANKEDRYLADNLIDGQALFPLGGYLLLVWKCLAKRCGKPFSEVPVVFENVTVHQPATFPKNGFLELSVSIMYISGDFEVRMADAVAASGSARIAVNAMSLPDEDILNAAAETTLYEMDAEDVYRELCLRGYDCGPALKGIMKAGIEKPFGKLRWEDNWVTFIESMLQFCTLTNPLRTLTTPYQLQFCLLDPEVQVQIVERSPDGGVDVFYNRRKNTCRSGGVLLGGLRKNIRKRHVEEPEQTLQECRFIPYMDDDAARMERQDKVQKYIEVCCGVARHLLESWSAKTSDNCDILKTLHEAPQKIIESYLENAPENHGLLQTLASIAREKTRTDSTLSNAIKSAVAVYQISIANYLLNTALFEEDTLGHLLDVAVENTSVEKIRVLELTLQHSLLAPWIIALLSESKNMLRVEYTVADASPDRLGPEQLPGGVKTVRWGPSFSSSAKVLEADLITVRESTLAFKRLEELAEDLHVLCKVNGFVLIAQRTALTPVETFLTAEGNIELRAHSISEMETALSARGFRLVGLKSNNTSALLLFRKRPVQAAKVEVIHLNAIISDSVEIVKKKVSEYRSKSDGENLWLFATGNSGVVGLTKCLRHDAGGDRIRCILHSSIRKQDEMTDLSPSNPAYKGVVERDLVTNVYRDGLWGCYRHVKAKTSGSPKKNTDFALLTVGICGDLDRLHWAESPLGYILSPSSGDSAEPTLCSVYCAPVNHQDAMFATEKPLLPGCVANAKYGLGQEFSGRDSKGRRVMGVVPGGAIATMVAADPVFLWEVPERWTLLEASTVAFAYSAAYYALLVRGNMRPGDAVLIHSGSSCVGQATISIALSMGCTVFASVGTNEERELMQKRFPQMEYWQFTNSQGFFLQNHIAQYTDGRGVDLVLNCKDGYSSAHVTSEPRLEPSNRNSIDVAGDFLEALHSGDAVALANKLRVAELVRHGINSGAVRPLDTTVFKIDRAGDAFQLVTSGNNARRKVVLQFRPEESHQHAGPFQPLCVEAASRTYFYAHKSYIILGGLSVFGMELADWMVARGCRKLVLTTGSGVRTGHQRLYLHRWQYFGATVRIIDTDISTEKGAMEVIKEALAMGPGGGIFNIAAALWNDLLQEQAAKASAALCEHIVNGTNHLDQLSREMCPQLDHFVVFTSTYPRHCSLGNAEWAYANSAVERICERRAAEGIAGLAIQWSALDDAGANSDVERSGAFSGRNVPQQIFLFLHLLERLLTQRSPVVSCDVKGEMLIPTSAKEENEQGLVRAVAKILGYEDPSKMDQNAALIDLGMDSVMGVEILHAIQHICGLALSMQNVRLLSLNALLDMSGNKGKSKAV